jgi:hypothetical protein
LGEHLLETIESANLDCMNIDPDLATALEKMKRGQNYNLAPARSDLQFMSNPGRDDREKWVLARWSALTGRLANSFQKGERPDFTSSDEAVEITEALLPGRKRTDEYREATKFLQQGNFPKPSDGSDLKAILVDAHTWIAKIVKDKAGKYKALSKDWILIVYANYSFSDRTRWDLLRQEITNVSTFREIHVLNANGNNVQVLRP